MTGLRLFVSVGLLLSRQRHSAARTRQHVPTRRRRALRRSDGVVPKGNRARRRLGEGALADIYERGLLGVVQDYAEAAKWYRKAAEQDNLAMQAALGELYEQGRGVPQDYVLADMWFNLAARDASEYSRKKRDEMAAKMTPDQIAEAQRLARESKPMK
jgi:TPR repeat protein